MKTTHFAWLAAGLLTLSGTALAQTTGLHASSQLTAGGPLPQPAPAPEGACPRPVLGGPPQPAPDAAEPSAPADLALLQQLPLAADGPPTPPPLPAELARVFPRGVRPVAGFRPDIAALATAKAIVGNRGLVTLALPLGGAGVLADGATPGQRLKLLTPAGERLVAVARPAAAGSHLLVVSAAPGLVGQPVFVVGLEHPTEPALDYEALALLGLRATQQLAQQLVAVQQQLVALRSQLAAAQQVNSALLLDHAEQEDLKQQLSLLQSQQAAAFSVARQHRGAGWLTD